MIETATTIAAVLLVLAAALTLIRVILGPSVADRMVALDTMLFIAVGGLGIFIVTTGDTIYVPVLVVAVITAFLSTVIVARYIEAENRNDH